MSSAKSVFAGNTHNQYNTDTIVKEVADFYGQSIRTLDTRSVITSAFSHFRAEYNANNDPTRVTYFYGIAPYVTSVECVTAQDLANKFFILYSAPNNNMFVIFYKVDGVGTAPVYPGAKFIEVSVLSTDNAAMVAAATAITISNLYADQFTILGRNSGNLSIATAGFGEVDNSLDVNTGFTITGTQGSQNLVTDLFISYSGVDPVFQGQVLKGYSFDIYSGKFTKNPELTVENVGIADSDGDKLEVNNDGSINVNVVSSGQQLISLFSEVDNVASGVTTEIVAYTATTDVYLQKVEIAGTNIAEFELTIDGVTQDKKRTFFNGNLENKFDFNQGLNILPGQTIRVYVVHNRPELGEFSARTQILQG